MKQWCMQFFLNRCIYFDTDLTILLIELQSKLSFFMLSSIVINYFSCYMLGAKFWTISYVYPQNIIVYVRFILHLEALFCQLSSPIMGKRVVFKTNEITGKMWICDVLIDHVLLATSWLSEFWLLMFYMCF